MDRDARVQILDGAVLQALITLEKVCIQTILLTAMAKY